MVANTEFEVYLIISAVLLFVAIVGVCAKRA